jgi:hypothetical protein
LIERAAKAVYALNPQRERYGDGAPMGPEIPWDDLPFGVADAVRSEVRAVLLALREPAGPMCEAGNAKLDSIGGAATVWQAMIDAALAEGE